MDIKWNGPLPDNIRLTISVFHQQLLPWIEIYLKDFQITGTTPEDFTKKILSLDDVTLTYDTTTNKVLDISA